MHLFNQVMLAKQGWCLLRYLDSLIARILKARYFPTWDFLTIGLGSSPSYAWRSILFGCQLLMQGIRWRVGNGRSIRAFHDPWIPSHDTFTPITPLCFLHKQVHVESFIHNGKRRTTLLNALFCSRDVDFILQIPISISGGRDQLIWHYTPKGLFPISSAYRLAVRKHMEQQPGVSFGLSDWLLFWHLPILPKIKIFTW